MYKSPDEVPLSPDSPPPCTLRLVPSTAPAGILTSIFLVFWTTPLPSHSWHSFLMYFPWPLHFLHVAVVENSPKGVLWVLVEAPLPLHSSQVMMPDLLSAPVPSHFSHSSMRGTLMVLAAPNAASSSSISKSYLKSEPLCLLLCLPWPPPKKFSNMLSKSNQKPPDSDMKSEKSNPPKPPPWNCAPAAPNWSYCCLFWSSPSTAAASLISLNFSAASGDLFKSGWYCFASFL